MNLEYYVSPVWFALIAILLVVYLIRTAGQFVAGLAFRRRHELKD